MHSKYEVGLNIYRLVSPVPLLMTCETSKRKYSAGKIQLCELRNLINDLGGIYCNTTILLQNAMIGFYHGKIQSPKLNGPEQKEMKRVTIMSEQSECNERAF